MADLLLERSTELAAIEKALRMARAGRSRALLVTGPPGSGRTAVLERARARADALGLTVLSARGEEGERQFAFALARRLLEPAGPLPGGYDTLLALNRALARRAPVLVTVDDAERADRESLDWLAFAGRRLGDRGVALLLAGETTAFEGAVVLPLRPFSERAVAALLHVHLGHGADAATVRACHLATGGHPLLVCELAAARDEASVPPGVARFAQRRLSGMPRSVRTLARALVLLERGATLHGAAMLAGLGPDHAASAADRLRAAGLLV